MLLFVLPVLLIAGVLFAFDFGGEDDKDDGNETPDQDQNRVDLGDGDDIAAGTSVTDFIFANGGDDLVSGGEGDDKLFLGSGQDATVELTQEGDFSTTGMEGNDLIRGGAGRDVLVDALGSNTIFGDTGYDRINVVDDASSENTADTVFGGFGNDTIFADGGDLLTGGAGSDAFQVVADTNGGPAVVTDFEEGDRLVLRDPEGGRYVEDRITSELAENGEDTNVLVDGKLAVVLQGVKTPLSDDAINNPTISPLWGTEGDDDLQIDDFENRVVAYGGDDTIGFAEGEDTDRDIEVLAGAGNDVVETGLGDDVISGSLGDDMIIGGGGADEIDGGFGADVLDSTDAGSNATDDADIVNGDGGDDVFFADNGDALTGGAGKDLFSIDLSNPEAAAVTINDFDTENEMLRGTVTLPQGVEPTVAYVASESVTGTDVVVEGRVAVTLIGVTPDELSFENVEITNVNSPVLRGTDEADTLFVRAADETVISYEGNDTIKFAAGQDTSGRDMSIVAGEGDDTVKMGLGDDTIAGGLGDDRLFGGGGADEIEGGFGDDWLRSDDGGSDDAADVVNGGGGKDTFFADNGDVLSGGAGRDEFNIDLSDPESAAVVITDFDPSSEMFNGTIPLAAGVTPTVSFAIAADGSGTNVVVEGRVVATLAGVNPNQLSADNVDISNSTPAA